MVTDRSPWSPLGAHGPQYGPLGATIGLVWHNFVVFLIFYAFVIAFLSFSSHFTAFFANSLQKPDQNAHLMLKTRIKAQLFSTSYGKTRQKTRVCGAVWAFSLRFTMFFASLPQKPRTLISNPRTLIAFSAFWQPPGVIFGPLGTSWGHFVAKA